MPVQGSASLAGLTAYITWITIRVGQMLGLHMVEDSQPTMVDELVADVTYYKTMLTRCFYIGCG